MKRLIAALAGTLLVTSCGGGGGGSSQTTVNGSFVASEVEGIRVCDAGTFLCTYTDAEGKFSLTAASETPLLYFYAGGVKVGEYRLKENGETVTPFKLTATPQAGALLAKAIHAVAGDATGTAPQISLYGLQIEPSPQVESLAQAVEEGVDLTLTVVTEEGESYQVKVNPQDQEVELCTEEGCQEVNYREWLVLVYMDGDNSLSDYVDADIDELSQVRYSPMVKVVALADYRGEDGGVIVESSDETGEIVWREVPEPDMGSQSTLEEFVRENMDRYPALKTALILWNHGDGWRAPSKLASVDESSNSTLYMYEVVNALSNLQEDNYRIDLIGFDECLMGMAEVFYDAGKFAQAVVASETYEEGSGWDYRKIMEELNEFPQMDAYQMGQLIVDAYRETYGELSDKTMTVLSKEEIERLTENLNALAGELSQDTFGYFSEARSNAVTVTDYPYADLYSLVENLPFESAGEIKTLIENAYSFSSSPDRFRGISIYFPSTRDEDPNYPCYLKETPGGSVICFDDPDYYNPFAVNGWDEFLENYYSMEEE